LGAGGVDRLSRMKAGSLALQMHQSKFEPLHASVQFMQP